MEGRLGVVLPPQDPHLAVTDLVGFAQLAERSGYDAVFTPEAFSYDALCLMSAVAVATSRVQLGTAIVTLPVRTPALTAMGSLTVDMLSGGRFSIGLGMGHRRMVDGVHGVDFEPSLQQMREYVEIIHRFIAGEEMQFEGKVLRSTRGRVGVVPQRPRLPVYLAALMPGAVRLAGEIADGILPYYATPTYLARVLALLAEGAERAGRDPAEIDVALLVPTCVTDQPAAAREAARMQIAWYNAFEFYNNMFREAGFVGEADALRAEWAAIDADPERRKIWSRSRDVEGADAGTSRFVSDEMVDSIFVIGTADECRRRLAAYHDLGVTTPLVFPQGVHADRDEAIAGISRTILGCAPWAVGSG